MRLQWRGARLRGGLVTLGAPVTVVLSLVSDLLAGGMPEHLALAVAVAASVAVAQALLTGRDGGLAILSAVLLAQPVLHVLLKAAYDASWVDHPEPGAHPAEFVLLGVHVVLAVATSVAVSFGADILRLARAVLVRWQNVFRVRLPDAVAAVSRSRGTPFRAGNVLSDISRRGPPLAAAARY